MSCYDCGHRVKGLGCTRKGLDNAKRVTDHDHCSHWQTEDNLDTVIGKEIANTRRFDKDLPFGYLRLEYGERNEPMEEFKKLINRMTG